MRLPRDIGGQDLARRLAVYGYSISRQTGSHLKLTSNMAGREHNITITTSRLLRMATLNEILAEVGSYVDVDRDTLTNALFTS
jgi:predicted RNA binding protein YcfA (HicA-like mRNA interferase family)